MFKKSYLLCIPTLHDAAMIKNKRSCQLLIAITIERHTYTLYMLLQHPYKQYIFSSNAT